MRIARASGLHRWEGMTRDERDRDRARDTDYLLQQAFDALSAEDKRRYVRAFAYNIVDTIPRMPWDAERWLAPVDVRGAFEMGVACIRDGNFVDVYLLRMRGSTPPPGSLYTLAQRIHGVLGEPWNMQLKYGQLRVVCSDIEAHFGDRDVALHGRYSDTFETINPLNVHSLRIVLRRDDTRGLTETIGMILGFLMRQEPVTGSHARPAVYWSLRARNPATGFAAETD